jgi:hypothetical protein
MVQSTQLRFFLGVLFATLTASAALAQQRADPIGPLTKIQTFDRAQKVNLGRTKSGKVACYFREEGSSHSLDIGITTDGAYIRLETGDSRETTPAAPLRVFAGKENSKRVGANEFATGEFTVLQAYDGQFDYYIPKPEQDDFVVVAKGDARAFLEMVARANTQFVVVQSVTNPKSVNYVAIYNFKAATISALLACAKDRVK